MREGLLDRLDVLPFGIPSLRERLEPPGSWPNTCLSSPMLKTALRLAPSRGPGGRGRWGWPALLRGCGIESTGVDDPAFAVRWVAEGSVLSCPTHQPRTVRRHFLQGMGRYGQASWEKGTPRISRPCAWSSITGGVIVPAGQIVQASRTALSLPHGCGGESGQDERGTHRSELPTAD